MAAKCGPLVAGPLLWRWKDRIDRRFMRQARPICRRWRRPTCRRTRAAGAEDALGGKPMCGGCGAKVGRGALRAALAGLPASGRDDVEVLPGDDAAVLRMGDVRQVVTTDHLRAFTEDPVLMTRIAAVHALGDIWAMGAAPQAALATVILPPHVRGAAAPDAGRDHDDGGRGLRCGRGGDRRAAIPRWGPS